MKGKGGEKVIIPDAQSVYYSEETGTESIVLEDVFKPDYEPSETEILEYAAWLEMDIDNDGPLMWIAYQGLTTPLPENWRPIKNVKTADVYYFNFQTGESIWDHPLDEKFKTLYKRESQKRREGKPFKACPDDDTYEFVHGYPPPKDKKKNKKKESKGGLPEPLTKALCDASEKKTEGTPGSNSLAGARSKGKFGSLPSNPYKTKGSPLGPIASTESSMPAPALGRAALPGLGPSKSESPAAPITLRGLSSSKPLESKILSNPGNSATERSLEELTLEYQKLAEEEQRSAEQQQRRLKRQLDQELQDFELDLESKKNQIRREHLNQQSAWDQQLDEKRRNCESDLLEKYESWKKERDANHQSKVEEFKDDMKQSLDELTRKQDQLLQSLREDHDLDVETQRKAHENSLVKNPNPKFDDLRRQQEAAISNLLNDTEEEKRRLQLKLESDLRDLKDNHKKEEEEYNKKFIVKKESIQAEASRLEEQLRASRKNLNQLTLAIEKEKESIEETRQSRPVSSLSHLSEEMEEELAAARKRHELEKKQLDDQLAARKSEIDLKISALEQETRDKENRLLQVNQDLEATRSTIARQTPELEVLPIDDVDKEISQKHEAEKKKIQSTLDERKKEHNSRLRELENETETKEKSLRRVLQEANDHHTITMEELMSTYEYESQSQKAQLIATCEANVEKERSRLERDAIKQIESHAAHVNQQLSRQKEEEEQKMSNLVLQLRSESEQKKRELLKDGSTATIATHELDNKLDAFRTAEQQKLFTIKQQLTSESKIQEAHQRDQVNKDVQDRLKQFRELEEQHLKVACDEARYATDVKLKQITVKMNSELESKRTKIEEQIAESRRQLDLKQRELQQQQQQQQQQQHVFSSSPKSSEHASPEFIHQTLRTDLSSQHLEKEQLRQAKSYLRNQKKDLKSRQVCSFYFIPSV